MDLSQVMAILENMEDEEKAARLLKELNDATSELGKLIMVIHGMPIFQKCEDTQRHIAWQVKVLFQMVVILNFQ